MRSPASLPCGEDADSITDVVVIDPSILERFAVNVLKASGISDRHASDAAAHMRWADTHGRPNYGVWRLPILCRRAEAGLFGDGQDATTTELGPSLAIVDGHDAIGHHVGTYATDEAIRRAADTGLGFVGVKASNFMGAVGYYVERIAGNDMVGLLLTNASPRVAAHQGTAAVLGTNPIAFGAPVPGSDPIIVDLSTAAGAGSLITKSIEAGIPLPEGVAINPDGTPLTDPTRVGKGAMLPLAGPKGFGLALMVEILAGVMTGAGMSHGVHSMYKDFDHPANIGHAVFALRIDAMMPTGVYRDRIHSLLEILLDSGDVRLPGANRYDAAKTTMDRGGVELDGPTVEALEKLAADRDLTPPWDGGQQPWRTDVRELL